MSIENLFATPSILPTIPKVVHQLILSFSRDDITVEQIGRQLDADPVLSAKTLRLANSAYFHVSRRIATVDDALRMLGFVMVRNLVLGCGMAGAFKAVPGIDLPQFWRHSLGSAGAARWLAQAAGHNADLAFTLGLLHGLGQLLMHVAQPALVEPLDRECHPLAPERAALEQLRLGYHHAEVSAALAERWKFPAEVVGPLRQLPAPWLAQRPDPMAALIHVATWRAGVDTLELDSTTAGATFPSRACAVLGLPLAWLADSATLGGDHPALRTPMPPLAELGRGLEAMLH